MRQRPLGATNVDPVKASPEAQLRLLELADLDQELSRLAHRRRALPENAELDLLTARASQVRDDMTRADTELSDLDREQSRAERDVDQVRTRIDNDQRRLDAGKVSNARELESLQSEIASLRRRQSDLEEVVLDLMERREGAQSRRDEAAAAAEAVTSDVTDVTARKDAALAEIAEQESKAGSTRTSVASGVPGELLALYDRVRAQAGGVGAALLRRGKCEGCNESLSTVELNEIRAAAPDEVVRHEECRRILIRTGESGL
jgi:predicted  nucleic acid-binding Zn-ribbon protein